MTTWFVYLSFVAALNPARLREGLPERSGRGATVALVAGSVLAGAVAILVAVLADEILDALDITPETWRIAAGTVVGLVAMRVVVFPGRVPEPELSGPGKALVPVAFPLLLTPELLALASVYGATESVAVTIGGLLAGLAAGIAAGFLRRTRPGLWLATARLTASFAVIAGFALIVEGIRDV